MMAEYRMPLIFALGAILITLLIWKSLRRLHNDPTVQFDLRDLLMENGRVSKAACVMMGAFAVTTWQYIYFSMNGKMTEGYAAIYVAAWIAPVVARLIARDGGGATTATATTTTETTIKVPTP